jgi:hypothetical protein
MDIQFGDPIVVPMVLTDDKTPAVNKIVTFQIVKKNGKPQTPFGASQEVGLGFYQIAGNDHDSDTPGPLCVLATADGCDPWQMVYSVLPKDHPRDMRKTESLLSEIVGQNDELLTQLEPMIKRNS